ncbi:family 16 glycosylhydrolase [Hoylesella oralis]|uniref:glycoside hydrolase family 16 protein n=1 Tax=Hoylesella oralis TaxID=28134 RepID=UPI003616A246
MKNIIKVGVLLFTVPLYMQGQSVPISKAEVPAGWQYYDGDEFNGNKIDNKYWGLYDEKTVNYLYGNNNTNQQMAQTYRAGQVKIVPDGDRRVARITATRDGNPPTPTKVTSKMGWWSGALSSRDANLYTNEEGYKNPQKFYPLYSRIEMKAKIPYTYGTWMALWLRHYKGASMFEIDLEEFFVKYNWDKYKNNIFVINQSIHGHNRATNSVKYNLNSEQDRIQDMSFDPSADYHVYGAQIDKDIDEPNKHFVVSFLLDGRVRSVWRSIDYGDKYTRLLDSDITSGTLDKTWDIAVTGQIGALDKLGVGYPEDNPDFNNDKSKTPHSFIMDLDWLRTFKRVNIPLWFGETVYVSGNPQDGSHIMLPAKRFENAEIGDRIVIDIATTGITKYPYLDLCNASGQTLCTLKPDVTNGDAQVTFRIDTQDMLNKLKSEGCSIYGSGVKMFIICLDKHGDVAWNGFKKINWGEVLISAGEFNGKQNGVAVQAGDKLEITVCDAEDGARCFLRQNTKIEGQSDRPALSSDVEHYGNIIKIEKGSDERVYTFDLNVAAAKELCEFGLAITGKGYYLKQLKILKKGTTDIKEIPTKPAKDDAVYTLDGKKIADSYQKSTLRSGIYIVGGRKICVK